MSIQEAMRLLTRLLETVPGVIFVTPDQEPDGEGTRPVLRVAVRERTADIERMVPKRIRGIPVRLLERSGDPQA